MSKKYLILGSEGFIGKNVCDYFSNRGCEIKHYDIKNSLEEDARVKELNFEKYDVVIFLAWNVGGAKYLYRKDTQYDQLHDNLGLLNNVFSQYEKIDKSKTKMIYISTQLAEDCDTIYGVTKRFGEAWANLNSCLSLRFWNAYGSYETITEKSHVISDFIHQAMDSGVIKMRTNGQEKRQFVHMKDICRAIEHGIDNDIKGVYDVTTYQWVSIMEIANIIADQFGAKILVGNEIGGTQDVPIKGRMIGWSPSVNLEYGLKETIEKHRELK